MGSRSSKLVQLAAGLLQGRINRINRGEALAKQLDIEHKSRASASIGQVHRATWRAPDGVVHDVVLKVQFRGIAATIEGDLGLLERSRDLRQRPHLHLRELNLQSNSFTDEAAQLLASSPAVQGLRVLNVKKNKISDRGMTLLRQSPYLVNARVG